MGNTNLRLVHGVNARLRAAEDPRVKRAKIRTKAGKKRRRRRGH